MAKRYSTPEQGTLDWHVPLNENFTKLDRDVEIRDSDSNRDGYDPADGAKFLATDTGDVYIGDGSQWTQIGTVAPADTSDSTSSSSGEVSDGSVVAAPGDVQAIMDSEAPGHRWGAQRMQTVRLVSGAIYEPDSTWRIPGGIRLDCNGAVIRPTSDFNVLELERSTEVHEPRIDVRNVNFSSVAITIGAEGGGKAETPNPATVHDARLFSYDRTGVGIQFRGGDGACSMQRASGKIRNFDRGIEFRATGDGSDDWSNGNRFNGNINGSRIPIYLVAEGSAEVSGNIVRGQVQAHEKTEWIVRQEDAEDGVNIRSNTYVIYPWDTHQMNNEYRSMSNRNLERAPIWYIGTGQQEYNKMYAYDGRIGNDYIVNNSTLGADRNAVFNALQESRGAIDRDHPTIYQTQSADFHPGGNN